MTITDASLFLSLVVGFTVVLLWAYLGHRGSGSGTDSDEEKHRKD